MSAKLRNSPGDTNFILLQSMGAEYLEAAFVLIDDWNNPLNLKHHFPIAQLLGHSLELTLKGLLSIQTMAAGTGVPKTHDILILAQGSDVSSLIALSTIELAELRVLCAAYAAPHFVRYPHLGLLQLPDAKGIRILLELAKRLSIQLDALARQQNFKDQVVGQRIGDTS